MKYLGRFAPSPTGPLHQGSLVAALASYLDARAHQGHWLLRIEDIDAPRVVTGAAEHILRQLQELGLQWDGQALYQSNRHPAYKQAFEQLRQQGELYGCACTRSEIADALLRTRATLPPGELPYPGTCRTGLGERPARAWRLRVEPGEICINDRWNGTQCQDVAEEVGDFVLLRADGLWAYQLAVVVDDAAQGITHVVRGKDLLSSTPRQHLLQTRLGLPHPVWMHVPVVTNAEGQKLSKQTGAAPLDTRQPLKALQTAWAQLGFDAFPAESIDGFLLEARRRWARRWIDLL